MTDTHYFSVSVADAVVRDDGKMLAIRRRDNHEWQIPGGVVEPHEPLADAVRRAVNEETEYHVTPLGVSGNYKHLALDIVSVVFRCRLDGGSRTLGHESEEVEWLTALEVRGRMAEAHACRLLDAVDLPAPIARIHDGTTLTDEAHRLHEWRHRDGGIRCEPRGPIPFLGTRRPRGPRKSVANAASR